MNEKCEEKSPERPPMSKDLRKVRILIKRRHLTNSLRPSMAPAFKAQFRESEQQLFRVEWNRIQEVVHDLYRSFERGVKGPEENIRVPMKTLITAHDDVHVLLHSKAGCFVFDFIVQKILPDATQILYQSILDLTQEERDNVLFVQEPYDIGVNRSFSLELLTLAWRHFYFDILPELETVFLDVSGHSFMSIRLAALLAFRDGIVQKVLDELLEILQDQSKIKAQIVFLRQMVLLLQNASDRCPIPECQFDLDKLVPLVVKSYFPSLYSYGSVLDGGDVDPDDSSSHNDSSDDESYSLPFCTASSPGAETLFSVLTLSSESLLEEAEEVNKVSVGNSIDDIKEVNTDEPLDD